MGIQEEKKMAEEYLLEVRHLDKFFTIKGGGLGKKPEILRKCIRFCKIFRARRIYKGIL